jgi:hypothetical protein
MPSVTAPPEILRTSRGIDEALTGASSHHDPVETANLENQDTVNLSDLRAKAIDDRGSGLER